MQPDHWFGVEIRHFAALQAIATEHSFGRAAVRLAYTQSAISQQIATLERIVGEQLIERPGGPRPVSLTEAGALLLRHADAIVARLEAAQADLQALRTGEIGVLRIGTFQSAGSRLLPPIMRRFVAQWPDIDVSIVELDDAGVEPALERGEVDVGFVQLPVGDAPLETIELMRDPHVLVTPKGSPLVAKKTPSLREIAREPLVGFREPHTIIDAFRAAGVDPEWRFRSNDNPTVQALVAAGIGNAVMPKLTVDERDPRVEIVDLPSVPPRIIALARHRDRYASPAMRAFIETATATRP
ncbi:MAG TPA: LysR family transcriptional regulator [Gaiellaceae bacterium]